MLDVRLVDHVPDDAVAAERSGDAGARGAGAGRPVDSPAAALIRGGELARGAEPPSLAVTVPGWTGELLAAFVEGLALGAYRFTLATAPAPVLERVGIAGSSDADAVRLGLQRARGVTWARDLINTPASTKTPAWLGTQASTELAPLGVDVEVRDEAWLAEQGFGGMLAVGGGSPSPPRLIEARWRPRGAASGVHVVLVGKGITFDTGGLNLKPGGSMSTMHTDMAGSAAVLGALRTVAAARVEVRVTLLAPCAENSFGGASYRPGDVVRHYGGRTTEVNNTDAEGRMVLGDALAWAVRRLRPTHLVDIATLTGGVKVALGERTGGLFATDEPLAAGLAAAGEASAEPLWRLPLPADYESTLRSEVADAIQSPGNPQAVTAAMFLRAFAGDVPWAHLDIAGPGRAADDDGLVSKGGTAFGARLLARWVESLATR